MSDIVDININKKWKEKRKRKIYRPIFKFSDFLSDEGSSDFGFVSVNCESTVRLKCIQESRWLSECEIGDIKI